MTFVARTYEKEKNIQFLVKLKDHYQKRLRCFKIRTGQHRNLVIKYKIDVVIGPLQISLSVRTSVRCNSYKFSM